MDNFGITKRQQDLLSAIIREFIDTAEAVGSNNLIDKYKFEISSATIRNEMAELVLRGYLYKKHSSSGRIPTPKAWRFFVDKIKQNEINYIDASIKKEVEAGLVKASVEVSNLIRQGLEFLSMISENATIALVGSDLYYAGLSSLPKLPEMQDADNLKQILAILEDYYTLTEVFKDKNVQNGNINVLIGEEEVGKKEFKNYSVLFSKVSFKHGEEGFIAVIGPNRMDYQKIISGMKYIIETMKHLLK
jgi:transcriptional regulator of heat shock response